MQDSKLENTSGFLDEEKQLLLLLAIYAVAMALCRFLGRDGGPLALLDMVSMVDWFIFSKERFPRFTIPLQMMPFLLIPFIALFWAAGKRSRSSLLFVTIMSGIGIADHALACAALPFIYFTTVIFGGGRLFLLLFVLTFALALGLAFLSRKIYRLAQSLYSQKSETAFRPAITLLVVIICFASPFVNQEIIQKAVRTFFPSASIENVTLLKPGSDIRFMDGSPDGKLLAVAADDGVSVWDAESQECIWSDDTVNAQRVRFSTSGKYLAVAGRGVPEGSSDLAIFEVDGFKRLPAVAWPEDNLRKKKIFHDLAFRPDEKSLLIAWHREWDWSKFPKKGYEQEARDLEKRDQEELFKRYPSIKSKFRYTIAQELICTELKFINKSELTSKLVNVLAEVTDLLKDGAIYFTPDASSLLYPSCHDNDNPKVERNRVYLQDIHTDAEEEIWLDTKYSMFNGGGNSYWYEWQFSQNEKAAYLLAEVYEVQEGYGFALLKMDMKTKQTQELLKFPVKNPIRLWRRIAFSPNESKVALLGYGGEKIASLYILDLAKNTMKIFAYKHDGRRIGPPWRLVWLSREILAISLSERNGFFFINIKEEEQ